MNYKDYPPDVRLMINKCVENPLGLRCFINNIGELIISPKLNAWFRLDNIENELIFKCKCLEFLSFHVANNHWFGMDKERKKIEGFINYILNTRFTHEDYQKIYCRLGNGVNRALTIKFIESGYDIKLLEENK